ncbi:MAG TPA: endonuclease/exonuclease/phosphatase family protein [Paracoccaceae bacterium]|nr:endonuclease/exonuclease/phosphatase family protein [Paracoccaceae bacterium]
MRLRLASYNIRKAVGLDWRRDPKRILQVIDGLGADIVALQEADKRLGPRPSAIPPRAIARETGLRPVKLAGSPVSLGWHGNALLVREELEVERTDLIELPGIEPRGSVLVRLATEGKKLTVIGVHLGLRRRCRQLQFERILETLGEEELAHAVILGDFNEWSPDRGVEPLLPQFNVVSPGLSFHASQQVAPLDRFALGPALELLDMGVETGEIARMASDHLPVWTDVVLN